MGLSAGSYPALLMGYRLQAELIVSMVGRFPAERHVATLLRMVLDIRNAVKRGRRPRVVLAYGADRSRDRNFAWIVGRLTGGGRLEVATPGREVAHRRFFSDMLDDGTLGRFLEMTVLAPMQAPLLAGEADAVAGQREGDGAGDDAALRKRHRQALADDAAVGEGGAGDEAGQRIADAVGERPEGSLQCDLGEAERERAQHIAEAPTPDGEVHEGLGQRTGEARAGLGNLGELRLQRARIGVDGDGEGGGEIVGHGVRS